MPIPVESEKPTGSGTWVREIPIPRIQPNPRQPRRSFPEEELEELAASIREHGILQPLLLRAVGAGYEIVSGERRLKAAALAGLGTVPSILVDPEDPAGSLTVALVENVQRADLNAVELARAYRQLQEEFGRTQGEIAGTVGKSRPHVANTLRLLDLPGPIQEAIGEGAITAGHARALLTAPEHVRELLFRRIVSRDLSVRQAERAARKAAKPVASRGGTGRDEEGSEDPSAAHKVSEMQRALESSLQRKVAIDRGKEGRGRLVLEFYGDRDLEALVERLIG